MSWLTKVRSRIRPSRAPQGLLSAPWRWATLLSLGAATLVALPGAAQTAPEPSVLDRSYRFLVTFPAAGQADSPFWDSIDSNSVQTDEMISPTHMSTPSFWYNRDQLPTRLGGRRLISSWMAYQTDEHSMPVVDVVVNAQYWSVLNYFEQYGVVNALGQSAKDFGYNLRIYRGSLYNRELLGLHVCDFTPVALTKDSLPLGDRAATLSCRASLDMQGIRGFQGNGGSNPFLENFQNGNGNGNGSFF
ncbi:MAG: hypothetical protein ICV62_09440 [Cyanobacteria bacterium Co-bin13]|nr:hypothetical protein [Cyanobacteria bacterium Co-bin13]